MQTYLDQLREQVRLKQVAANESKKQSPDRPSAKEYIEQRKWVKPTWKRKHHQLDLSPTPKLSRSFDSGQRTSVLEKRILRMDLRQELSMNLATSEVIN